MAPDPHLLRLFAAVARTGSFSRAADDLNVSQPAISRGVRAFEPQVGWRLLDRGPGGVRPTREGEAPLRQAKPWFARERAAEEELRSPRGLGKGVLRIGASTTIATDMLPSDLGSIHRAYPGIAITSVAAIRDQVALGTPIAVPIRRVRIERTLWRLTVPGRRANPATLTFARLIQI